jgi:hypothetical protein
MHPHGYRVICREAGVRITIYRYKKLRRADMPGARLRADEIATETLEPCTKGYESFRIFWSIFTAVVITYPDRDLRAAEVASLFSTRATHSLGLILGFFLFTSFRTATIFLRFLEQVNLLFQ